MSTPPFDADQMPATMRSGRPIIYLAAPYTDPDSRVRLRRFQRVTAAAAALAADGKVVFSPITMTHPMDVLLAKGKGTLGTDHWIAFDEAFMECCSEMRVLCLEGWGSSIGIKREINFFQSRGRPITFIDPHSLAMSVDLAQTPLALSAQN